MKTVCVIGLGYIGLPTSVILATNNCRVIGVDINREVVEAVNRGEAHIKEPGINKLLRKVVRQGKLVAKTEPESADFFIIAVPTPVDAQKSCELGYVISATELVLPVLKEENVIIIESTIPPGTTEEIVGSMVEQKGFKIGKTVYLAHCPERVLPGNIIREMVDNDRVIGGCTDKCAQKAAALYKEFVRGKLLLTDARTAEMSKLVENTFRDVNIAFANELIKICNSLDINGLDVISLANRHPRVNILQPGPGVGGHCLAVDPYFIVEKAPELAKIISAARAVNSSMPVYIVEKVKQLVTDPVKAKIAILGVAYKGNVDDTRESPALEVIRLLQKEGFNIAVSDPYVEKIEDVKLESFEDAVKDADIAVILTDHDEYKALNSKLLAKSKGKKPIIFDTRNIVPALNHQFIKNLGNIK